MLVTNILRKCTIYIFFCDNFVFCDENWSTFKIVQIIIVAAL